MARHHQHREVPEARRASEHLDNERTFLSWVRTNVALISLGFVLARVSPSLTAVTNGHRIVTKTLSVGITLIVFGAVVTVLAAWRYDRVNRQIEAGVIKTDRAMVWFVAVTIVLLSAAAVVYMLLSA